jgi:hypothetical protein
MCFLSFHSRTLEMQENIVLVTKPFRSVCCDPYIGRPRGDGLFVIVFLSCTSACYAISRVFSRVFSRVTTHVSSPYRRVVRCLFFTSRLFSNCRRTCAHPFVLMYGCSSESQPRRCGRKQIIKIGAKLLHICKIKDQEASSIRNPENKNSLTLLG